MEMKEKLREITVGAPKNFKSETVEIDGVEFEVRQPSVEDRGKLMSKAGVTSTRDLDDMDYASLQAYSVIYCTYVPGTDEKVFSEDDYETIKNCPAGSWVDQLNAPIMNLMNVQPEEDAKN